MPYINNTPQVMLNYSILKRLKDEVDILRQENKKLKEDIEKMNEKMDFIYSYIVKKKEREDSRWF